MLAALRSSYTKQIDALIKSGVIRPSSKGWLISALDPFHDKSFDIEGLPDQYGGSTCVQFIKKQVTITAPVGIAPGEKWDCHIFTAPILESTVAHPCLSNPSAVRQQQAVTGGLGTVNVVKAVQTPGYPALLPNRAIFPFVPPDHWGMTCYSPADDGNNYSMMRLVGGGFEVKNTTASYYKSGSVTVYSQPQTSVHHSDMVCAIDYTSPTVQHTLSVNKARLPPSTLDQAILNTNSTTWEAEHGVYVPFRLQTSEANYALGTNRPLLMAFAEDSVTYANEYAGYMSEVAANVNDSRGDLARSMQIIRHQPLHTVGAFFTGLMPEAVLTLDIRFFVEVAPTSANPSLLSLASPSPAFDPVALELYTRALGELLPGCMVAENASGEWWSRVSNALKFIAPLLSGLGPYGKLASVAVNSGAELGDIIKAQRQARKEREKNKPASANQKAKQAQPSSTEPRGRR